MKDCTRKTQKSPRPAEVVGDIAKIDLGFRAKNGHIIVDKEFAWLDRYNWHLSEGGYARSKAGGTIKLIHRMIIGVPPKGYYVDHIDGDPKNNRTENLRFVTNRQNVMNQGLHKSNTSGYKGIYRRVSDNRVSWLAKINDNGKQIHGGTFSTKEDAARRYDELAIKYFGDYARLNFPSDIIKA